MTAMHKNFSNTILATCFMACISLLGACSKKESIEKQLVIAKVSEPVAARVNDTEISVALINQMMQRAPNLNAQNETEIKRQILETLIDQEIIIEKANMESLDRVPEVMLAMEAAKKEVLAKAYLQKLVAESSKITDEEVSEYYLEHSALFSKRRIYKLQDISTEKNADALAVMQKAAAKQRSVVVITKMLQKKGIKYSEETYTRPAEQLPLNILPKIQQLRKGEMLIVETHDVVHLMKLLQAEDAPISLEMADSSIRSFLLSTRSNAIVDEKIKSFRKQAKVEYVGDFSTLASHSTTDDSQANSGKVNILDKAVKTKSASSGVVSLK